MEQAQIDKLKADNPGAELLLLTSASAEVVAKVPTNKEMSVLRSKLAAEPKQKGPATEALVWSSIIFPDRAAVKALVDVRPLLLEKWGEQLFEAAGGAEEIEVKKL